MQEVFRSHMSDKSNATVVLSALIVGGGAYATGKPIETVFLLAFSAAAFNFAVNCVREIRSLSVRIARLEGALYEKSGAQDLKS
jgi:hypothetical protein